MPAAAPVLALVLSLGLAVAEPPQEGSVRVGTRRTDTSATARADAARRDSLRAARQDSLLLADTSARTGRARRPVRRAQVTPELEATAFADPTARELLLRARAARVRQDSSLRSYDARTVQRISVGMNLRAVGRERLLFRHEEAGRVHWSRDGGARVLLTGQRTGLPAIAGSRTVQEELASEVEGEFDGLAPIPYHPGQDVLWFGQGLARAEVDERDVVHPLAEGSEAYYRYATGDSVFITLSEGRRLTLRELRVDPRAPRWNLIVGSFWFDQATAQLVRAAYRFSTEMDIIAVARAEDPTAFDDVPVWVKPAIMPMTASLQVVTVEFGLYGGRFWLPRLNAAEGGARVGPVRVPVRFEQRFTYDDVNGVDTLPPLRLTGRSAVRAVRDSLDSAGVARPVRDSLVRAALAAQRLADTAGPPRRCGPGVASTRSVERRLDGALLVEVEVPCDRGALARSPELPGSLFDSGEALFDAAELRELAAALSFGRQAGWAPQRPTVAWGVGQTRYNRVEGVSSAVATSMVLGRGYTLVGEVRGSQGDRQVNSALGLARTDGRSTRTLRAYRRLASSNDWGDPFTFGASLMSAMYARDEGFYHRAAGGELALTAPRGGLLEARVFGEWQWAAPVTTTWSLFGGRGEEAFPGNPDAARGAWYGAALRHRRTWGLNPADWRLVHDLRLEGASGATDYGRAALDVTVSRALVGPLAFAVGGGAGTSAGDVPPQRRWALGGSRTIRGQTAGTAFGDAYWMARAELGGALAAARPIVFADWGWTGPRTAWSDQGAMQRGVGAGASFLDGLVRFDLSRGLAPRRQWRADVYVEAAF